MSLSCNSCESCSSVRIARVASFRRRRYYPSTLLPLLLKILLVSFVHTLVQAQPSATKLLSIPCDIIVPGNQQRAPNVYSLTECYYATVCIDQPVAADAIAPPTQAHVGSADPPTSPSPSPTPVSPSPSPTPATPTRQAPSNNTKFSDDGIAEPAATFDPGNVGTAKTNQPKQALPGLSAPASAAGHQGGVKRGLRGSDQQKEGRSLQQQEFDEHGMPIGEAEEEDQQVGGDWDFRQQMWGSSTGGYGDGGSGMDAVLSPQGGGEAGMTENPMEGGMPAGDVQKDGAEQGAPDVTPKTGTGQQDDQQAAADTAAAARDAAANAAHAAADAAAQAQAQEEALSDEIAGRVAEITIVRLCSREHVCQECGAINVVPRCTCSLVLYDPLTDPDYFLK